MCVSNFQVHLFTNVLKFWCYEPNLCSPGQGRFYCFPFVHHFLTHSCLMFTEFSSACNWKQISQSPASKRRTYFCDPRFSFSFFWLSEIKKIFFSFVLYSPRERKRKDNYRYLWQWIIEIFVITQPNKLCIKREIIVEIVLSKKKT